MSRSSGQAPETARPPARPRLSPSPGNRRTTLPLPAIRAVHAATAGAGASVASHDPLTIDAI
ncbi:hypothetical protein [Acidiphilium angustum]|uniref:hypothetical protein n=1 Tax=Acidiphilium angustum TaxID=523 RepID=UPI000A8F4FC3|nr:hypothetical protein [Acidiphilium angustum]